MEKNKSLIGKIITVLMTLVGTFIMAIGNMAFLRVYDIVTGGFTGLAIILNATIIKFITPGIISIILNIPLFIYAYRLLGMKYIQLGILGTLAYSVFIDVIPLLNFDFMSITQGETLLATIYGGIIVGVGYGIVVKQGASTGGSNTLADVIKAKKPSVSFGTILLIIDGIVVLLSVFAFGVDKALYAFIVIFLSSKVADYILEGKKSSKVFYIVSSVPDDLANAIFERVGRGVTALKGRGSYTGTERDVLMCVILRSQTNDLKSVIYDIDPNAFVISQNAGEVFGDGFVKLPESKKKKKRLKTYYLNKAYKQNKLKTVTLPPKGTKTIHAKLNAVSEQATDEKISNLENNIHKSEK